MIALFKKEFKSMFVSPMGYSVIAAYFFLNAILFIFGVIFMEKTSDLTGYFSNIILFVVLIISVLSMKFFSEERKNKTDQLLLTSPVSLFSIVFAKFLSGLSVFAIASAATLTFLIPVAIFGDPDYLLILNSYLGLFLMGAAMIAICVFISSLTQSSVVCAIVSLLVFMLVFLYGYIYSYIINFFSTSAPAIEAAVRNFLAVFMLYSKYVYFTSGLLDIPSVVYYISIIAVFLFLTVMTLEKRRWS